MDSQQRRAITTAARKRARARGAAMVEAIVIMTTMLVFLGMNVWAYKAYGGKIDQANSTRRDALYFASHSCEGANGSDPDSYTVAALKGNRNSGGGSSLSLRGMVEAVRGGGGSFDLVGTARSEKGPTAVSGTAIINANPQGGIKLVKAPLTARLATASAVGCNEKPLGDKFIALLRLGKDALMSIVTG
jgi:hypothetical protein